MTLNEGRDAISRSLKKPLAGWGFEERKRMCFVKEQDAGTLAILAFGGRIDSSGMFCFSFGVGIQFAILERLLRPRAIKQELFATIGVPIHLLRPERNFAEWRIASDVEMEEVRGEIVRDIEMLALPFLGSNKKLVDVRRKLESPDPRAWYTLTSEDRLALLAAIRFSSGEQQEAIGILEGALAEMKHAPLKKTKPIVELHERLRSELAPLKIARESDGAKSQG